MSYRNEGAVSAAAEGGSRFTFQVTLDAAPTSRICGRSMRVVVVLGGSTSSEASLSAR